MGYYLRSLDYPLDELECAQRTYRTLYTYANLLEQRSEQTGWWDYNIPLTDNYSAWYQGLNAFEGNTYAHVSYLGWNLARPFGYLVL